MPTRFMAILGALLALMVLVSATPEIVDSLAPDPVPRDSLDLIADTRQVLVNEVAVTSGDEHREILNEPMLMSYVGNTNPSVPHDPG